MSLTADDVKKIANLAQLIVDENDPAINPVQLSSILQFIAQLNAVDTSTIEPLAHPLDLAQRLRGDVLTEPNLRDKYQRIAPQVEAGLYLVPKVIEGAE